MGTEDQQVRGRFVALESYTFAKWLELQENLQDLKQRGNGHEILFPRLRPVWNEVRTSTIDGAIVSLNRKKSESKKTMSLLGLTANEEIVVFGAPLATLCVIIYLFTHILHIRSIANKDLAILSEFPWIALFRGILGRSLTYGSILLLPFIANVVVLIRAWDLHSGFTWLGFLLAIASSAVGLITLREIARLQQYAQKGQDGVKL